jgi:hypothetical protein
MTVSGIPTERTTYQIIAIPASLQLRKNNTLDSGLGRFSSPNHHTIRHVRGAPSEFINNQLKGAKTEVMVFGLWFLRTASVLNKWSTLTKILGFEWKLFMLAGQRRQVQTSIFPFTKTFS